MRALFAALLLLALPAAAAPKAAPWPELDELLERYLRSPEERASVSAYAAQVVKKAGDAEAQSFLRAQIERNLKEKLSPGGPSNQTFPLTATDIRRTVIDYESFKYATFRSSGVFPKRYFGYFDLKWDTAKYEERLRVVAHTAVEVINAYQAKRGRTVRLNDAEVAVTFIAEGGAILLREKQNELEQIHPVQGVGLDDIATGFALHPELLKTFDQRLGTHLTEIVDTSSGRPMLRRWMNFDEAILGTAVMYVYEKELAETKLQQSQKKALQTLPLDEQFIVGSLMYNSGKLFTHDRVEMIRDLETASYVYKVSQDSLKKRWALPLFDPLRMDDKLFGVGGGYPDQQTSWSTVYHVLQRYGAFKALQKCTDVFDAQGMFRAK